MVSDFPYLLSYSFFAPTILRVVTGIYFVAFGVKNLNEKYSEKIELFSKAGFKFPIIFVAFLSFFEISGGIMLIAGKSVQIVSLVFAVICIVAITIKTHLPGIISTKKNTYILLAVILLSLVLTGAGAFGSDLPV